MAHRETINQGGMPASPVFSRFPIVMVFLPVLRTSLGMSNERIRQIFGNPFGPEKITVSLILISMLQARGPSFSLASRSNPDIDHIDLGSVGWWGEWHLSGSKNVKLPTLEKRKKIIDAYLAAFKKTPLLMLIGGDECLSYAASHGTGWRADCLGDMGGFSKNWCHMRKGYPVYIKAAGIDDTWKTAPVAWECWRGFCSIELASPEELVLRTASPIELDV